ncbi:hypothetical protein DXG01_005292 [Tephrocybe rancida]|nr:hypothetical protein DXG01_005292 [Tephrocybe rancida]
MNPYYYQRPAPRQPQVDDRYAMGAYLLGMGPLPPPRPEEIAVARFNAALNNGGFDPTVHHNDQPAAVENRVTPPPTVAQILEVRLPVPREDGGQPTIVPIRIKTDIEPRDFLARVIANLDLDPGSAQLGWKSCDDTKTSHPRRLKTDEDVQCAFDEMVKLLTSTRRKRPVFMEVVNLTKPAVPVPSAPKPSETAASEEMKIVKEKLRCAQHPGANRWCFVKNDRDGNAGRHVPLGIAELSLWAREMRDGRCDRECKLAPEILRLDDLVNAERERSEPRGSRRYGPAQPAMPAIHVHLTDSPIGEVLVPRERNQAKHKRKRQDTPPDNDSDTDDVPVIAISELLESLHSVRPALNYPQYERALLKAGIAYTNAVLEFDKSFFASEKIGMPLGAIGDFLRAARSAMKKGKQDRKKAREDKENDASSASASDV